MRSRGRGVSRRAAVYHWSCTWALPQSEKKSGLEITPCRRGNKGIMMSERCTLKEAFWNSQPSVRANAYMSCPGHFRLAGHAMFGYSGVPPLHFRAYQYLNTLVKMAYAGGGTRTEQVCSWPAATVVLQPRNANALAPCIGISRSAPIARNRRIGDRHCETCCPARHILHFLHCTPAACWAPAAQAKSSAVIAVYSAKRPDRSEAGGCMVQARQSP
jgi:hypothetical protein